MKPVLTNSEYKRVEGAYEGDMADAMERAGHAVALAAARRGARYGSRVVVLAGPGNNGGDGYVAATHLARRGTSIEIHRLGPPSTELGKAAAARARAEGVRVVDLGPVVDCDLVVDALFGGGVRAGLPDEVEAWMGTTVPVIAVDYPTGLDPDTGKVAEKAFRAVETVTFGAVKTGHVTGVGPDYCGKITVADIGIHGGEPSLWIAEEDDAPRPARARSAHKWSAGGVLVVGGSDGMVGAAVMAAQAALNFGASAVYLSSPQSDEAHLMVPQIPTLSLDEVESRLERFDVLVVGPGLGTEDIDQVLPIVAKAQKVLLDAGGLVPSMIDAAREGDARVILTPHGGEFQRIAGVSSGQYAVRSFAVRSGAVVVLKGNPTRISDGGLPILVDTGGPELATIGTGDVLSGMIGALWARGLEPLEAAVSGVYWHGVTASSLAQERAVTADRLAIECGAFAW